jgi:hypothetical protein
MNLKEKRNTGHTKRKSDRKQYGATGNSVPVNSLSSRHRHKAACTVSRLAEPCFLEKTRHKHAIRQSYSFITTSLVLSSCCNAILSLCLCTLSVLAPPPKCQHFMTHVLRGSSSRMSRGTEIFTVLSLSFSRVVVTRFCLSLALSLSLSLHTFCSSFPPKPGQHFTRHDMTPVLKINRAPASEAQVHGCHVVQRSSRFLSRSSITGQRGVLVEWPSFSLL